MQLLFPVSCHNKCIPPQPDEVLIGWCRQVTFFLSRCNRLWVLLRLYTRELGVLFVVPTVGGGAKANCFVWFYTLTRHTVVGPLLNCTLIVKKRLIVFVFELYRKEIWW